jgi:WD40 repeat protein
MPLRKKGTPERIMPLRPLSTLKICDREVLAAAIDPDSSWLATGGIHDGMVRIWADDGAPELSRATD